MIKKYIDTVFSLALVVLFINQVLIYKELNKYKKDNEIEINIIKDKVADVSGATGINNLSIGLIIEIIKDLKNKADSKSSIYEI